ncbi:hypothetical protein HPB52_024380 [Rhipicephalus sanguineus]|uniref:Uncharacterized protein n=1 Tax=Rhipicephalus sanguineus TaxID=34632 RepID=A0A9D4TCH0_RHISA|nr:hypothetical protein HPB52_024380 [Rhipicephalus sanguineus]
MAPVRRKEFCPSYFAELAGPTRARYEAKISMCDGVDPYTLCAGTDTTTDVELLPVTTHADIVNYLVLWTNHVSLTEMKAYKSLEAHNYFTSGRVSGVTAKRLPSKRVIVLSEHRFLNSSKEPRRAFLAIDGYHVHRGQGIDQLAKIIVSSLARDFGPGVKSHAHSELGICYRLLKCSHCNTKGHEVLRVQQIPSPTFPT